MAKKPNVQAAVDRALKNWAKAEVPDDLNSENNDAVPDGVYAGKVTVAAIQEFAGKPIVRLTVKCEEAYTGPKDDYAEEKTAACDAGEEVHIRYGIDNPDGQGFLKRDLIRRFKFDAEEVNAIGSQDDLNEFLEDIFGCRVKFQVRTKNEWQNVYIAAVLDDGDDEEAEEEPSKKSKSKPAPSGKKTTKKAEPEPADEDDEDDEEDVDLNDLDVDDLKELAKDEGIDLGRAKTKKAIIAKIEAAKEEEDEDDEDEDGDEDEGTIEVGSHVVVTVKGKEHEAIVKEIMDDEDKCKVFVKSLKKRLTVGMDSVELIED